MIEYRHIHKTFDDVIVLSDINCVIPKNKTTVIIGPSGVGKSVFIKLLVGLLAPDKGEIFVEGEDITKYDEKEWRKYRKKIGMMFQDGALFDSYSVFENVAFPIKHHTKKSEDEISSIVKEKLKSVGLENIENKFPSDLSGGMRRRVGLARAIALEPEILLFDEPNTGLDPIMSDNIDNLIIEMKQKLNITFIIISHDIVGTFKVADTVGMLYESKLIEFCEVNKFLSSKNKIVQEFLKRNFYSIR
jgi:phospholipid/cholesterol/gamma-HCH transport system ATP-binding protein